MNFIKNSPKYKHWYPIYALMLGSGLIVGEVTGLRTEDIDFKHNVINVTHTLVFYDRSKAKKTGFGINTPKTKAGYRSVPMIKTVRDALLEQKQYLKIIILNLLISLMASVILFLLIALVMYSIKGL
ncbi:hypothetical protein [uncultured Gilliamella sp.]|uniref:hypothetical protein n=1 Tax=uncultured Gilliamella sp. TaxID=1193505 RepID=UPI0025D7E1A9|nr:hypothetical protein [uncultured Gilliamella sp.]